MSDLAINPRKGRKKGKAVRIDLAKTVEKSSSRPRAEGVFLKWFTTSAAPRLTIRYI
jgi:hypothetical protein